MSASPTPAASLLRSVTQFSLASLLLVTLWIAVGLALARVTPWLGGVYLLATLPATVRTWHFAVQLHFAGQSVDIQARIAVFLWSLKATGLLAATSLALVLGAIAASTAWVAALGLRGCGAAALLFGRVDGWTRAALRHTALATQWLFTHAATLFRKRPLWVMWSCGTALLLGAVAIATCCVVLATIVAALSALRLIADGAAKSLCWIERLRQALVRTTSALLTTECRLLREV